MRLRDRQSRRRQHRRHAFCPRAEGLEPRIALNAQLGVSLDYNEGYSGNPIWTDLHNTASAWAPASVALTADQYPLGNASTTFSVGNYPAGDYQFSYTGSGTVSFSGYGQLVGPVTVSGGVTSGTILVTGTEIQNATVTMQVANINASNPMDNFHLMMPGYGNGTTPEPMYTPAFIQALKPFSDIRFMNWEHINGTTLANWQDRVQPNSFIVTYTNGVAYEDMIELCNESQKDMWINIPPEATPQFVQSMAQLVATNLDPNLKVYLEYGNEDWNTSFAAYGQIAAAAASNPVLNQSLGQYQLIAQQSAYSLVTDGEVFEAAFGAGASRVLPVLGGQASYTAFQTYGLQFIQNHFGAPSQYIYATSVAPYFAYVSTSTADPTVSAVIASLSKNITSGQFPVMKADAAVAKQFGVPLVAYEGGPAIVPNSIDMNTLVQAQYDPRMDLLYQQYIDDWEQVGGGLFNQYQLTGVPGLTGLWGMLENVTQAGSQEYDGALATMFAPGDANLDGSVDWGDFQAVQADYDQGMAYWEQGNFNDDGTVNQADLNILRQGLSPAGFTLSQFAQQAVFGDAASVDAPTAMEYDGYGETNASALPLSSTSGTVQLGLDSRGNPIVLGGAAYAQGLGFTGGSSTTLTLGGQFARFDSTIGVDGDGSTASSVVFQVFGDGSLLYQSPVESYGSAAVPIDLNVAGVQKLTLIVEAAPGSAAANDHAVWADARLVSTSNFGSTTPYTLTWQVSQNGQVISTQTADSFAFAALSGTYTVTLTVADAQGDRATASTNVTVVPDVPTASMNLTDTGAKGDWISAYGAQGYAIPGEGTNLPAYASVSVAGASPFTWADSTTDPRGLQEPDGFGAGAYTWYGPSFTINVNLGDGQVHDLALYAVDWANQGRKEQIQIINPSTGAVLDTETISSFAGGEYLQWTVSGDVEIKVTSLISSAGAVIGGVFIDPASSARSDIVQVDGTTQGNWVGTYGKQGYDVEGYPASLPSYATISLSGASTWTWEWPATSVAALENPAATSRAATSWYGPSFTINVNLTDGKAHDLEIYALDWNNLGRVEQFQVINASTGAILGTKTISSFTAGMYLQFAISGNVEIVVTSLAQAGAVINGVFLDPGSVSTTSTATFLKQDATTEGAWIGTYGSQGYDVVGDTPSYPSYATVTPSGQSTWVWAAPTTDPRGLQNPSGSGNIAVTWYAPSFTINVNLGDGQVHDLALYAVDWANQGRKEQIQIIDATTGTVLDTETISSFVAGVYLQWAVSGDVEIEVTSLISSAGAVIGGVFIDPSTSGAVSTTSFVGVDANTQGNWIGTYGGQGNDVVGDRAGLPSYSQVTPSGQSTWIWAPSTDDPRGLQNPGGSGRIAATWYARSFTIGVNLTDGQSHNLDLYALDWDRQGRVEQIQIVSASTGAVLDTQTLSSFAAGVHVHWVIGGSVQIKVTSLTSSGAVVGGLFFDED